MLYIHKLSDLNPKNAEIESIKIIREIKTKTPFPVDEMKFYDYISVLFVTDTDKELIKEATSLVEPTLELIKGLRKQVENNPNYAHVTMDRCINNIYLLIDPLKTNQTYISDISHFQKSLLREFPYLINTLNTIKTSDDKLKYNTKFNEIFLRILRNIQMYYNGKGIVNEEQVKSIKALHSIIKNGFLFHESLQDEFRREELRPDVAAKILPYELQIIDAVEKNLLQIQKGIERAYDHNMRMVNLAVILYSYIKWVK